MPARPIIAPGDGPRRFGRIRRCRSDRTAPANFVPRFCMASRSISPRRCASISRAWSKFFRPSIAPLARLMNALPMRRRLSSFGPLRRTYIASPDGSGFCLMPRVHQRCVTIGGTLVRRCAALRCVVTVCLALAGFACADNHRTGVPGVSPVSTTSVSPVRLTPPSSTRCRLPVAGYQGGRRFWAGFLDLSSGRAIPADLPAGSPTASMVSYDPIGKRWLPVPERALSPDRRSYARLDITPAQTSRTASAQLYVIDVATEDSRLVWQSSGPNVAIVGWDDGVVLLNRLVGDVNREQGKSNGRFADF